MEAAPENAFHRMEGGSSRREGRVAECFAFPPPWGTAHGDRLKHRWGRMYRENRSVVPVCFEFLVLLGVDSEEGEGEGD